MFSRLRENPTTAISNLPRNVVGESATEPVQIASQPRQLPGSGRVLVIDDEPSFRDTLKVLIEIEGCDVRTAADTESALALINGWTPDLILLDLTFSGMNGAGFIGAYHRTHEPHAPIILMTGMPLDQTQAIAMGAAGILLKPFELMDLLDVVATFADCGDS